MDSDKSKTFQESSDKTVNVKDKITDIKTDLLFQYCSMTISDSILIINELTPSNAKGIHFFNKNSFKYITSTGFMGKGPGEITVLGESRSSYNSKAIWVDDYGKMVSWKFPIDSILSNENFIPTEKLKMNKDSFQVKSVFINDSITIGRSVIPTSYHSMDISTTKLNNYTYKIEEYGYIYPDLKGRESYSSFDLSTKNEIYTTCFSYVDLITICDLKGNLRYNIYGPQWNPKETKGIQFYGVVKTYKNYIIASYIGDKHVVFTDEGGRVDIAPSKLLVFDINGNYVKTIEVGYEFSEFCIDEENNRVIAYFDNRINPLGYFSLDI
ncbi:hypothetical protein BZG01_10905 [Labilibaculum manganireducens]|uniref:6-bladed beta-propeller n=1 Tax=Labilibaculum manganireducens TaxID=1940525 RepID=A0A2N3I894_9BACT|nr:hypothetical protein [Labilibaculum manganireducens]PKQ66526.1 hypothetical protein BZG01_10905 [Labilibaculum manganireducens]